MRNLLKNSITTVFFGSLLIAFCSIGIYRYNIGQVFYYDFGIFAHTIWQLSRIQVPVIHHIVLGNVVFLGDHFNPGLMLLAPLFWLTSDLRILLIEQAFALTASGVMVFLIALRSRLRYISAIAVSAAYLFFAGSENPLVTDWHPENTAAFFLLLFVYLYIFTARRILSIFVFIAFLSLKESNAISAVALLIPLLIFIRDKRKQTALLIVFSMLYFVIAVKVIIPYFAHQPYIYSPHISYSPIQIAQNFVNSSSKIKLINDSFLSFGYLPILSGVLLLPVFSELAFRLAPDSTIFNNLTLGQHYNVLLGVFLALATLFSLKVIQKLTRNNPIPEAGFSLYLILVSLYVARKITGSPINLAINPTFWQQLQPRESFFRSIEKVPRLGSVMAQNNVLPFVVNRKEQVFLTTVNYELVMPEIIVLDLSDTQNVNNFYGSNRSSVEDVEIKLRSDSKYTKVDTANKKIFIYVRK
ncbi:MAG: DUF2079 domain-containing protein [bacterium]|nr:DUF2079 domain-containing protein [bacterium]